MEYILYCDESKQKSSLFGDFFGGCIISAKDWQYLTDELNAKKTELNLYGEVKWSKVTNNYLNKYIELVDLFFSFIKTGKVKIRIMFQKNEDEPLLTDKEKPSERYLRQYYLFIKNAFGLKHLKCENPIYLRVYLDRLPNDKKKRLEFRQLLRAMPYTAGFINSPIIIRDGDVAEVRSHEHAILQCMDIILGSMYFRLNDIVPNFNISETTSAQDENVPECYWKHAYRHWRYIPE